MLFYLHSKQKKLGYMKSGGKGLGEACNPCIRNVATPYVPWTAGMLVWRYNEMVPVCIL